MKEAFVFRGIVSQADVYVLEMQRFYRKGEMCFMRVHR